MTEFLLTQVPAVPRPWGRYDILGEGTRWRTKRLVVQPGKGTSLQRHKHRTEYWTVVEGTAQITHRADLLVGDRVFGDCLMVEGDSLVIRPMEWHQIMNPGRIPLVIVETWLGEYLSEDDIERVSS